MSLFGNDTVEITVEIDTELLDRLHTQATGNRNGYRNAVVGAQPIDGVSVTIPEEHASGADRDSDKQMSSEELLEWVVYNLARNRHNRL